MIQWRANEILQQVFRKNKSAIISKSGSTVDPHWFYLGHMFLQMIRTTGIEIQFPMSFFCKVHIEHRNCNAEGQ